MSHDVFAKQSNVESFDGGGFPSGNHPLGNSDVAKRTDWVCRSNLVIHVDSLKNYRGISPSLPVPQKVRWMGGDGNAPIFLVSPQVAGGLWRFPTKLACCGPGHLINENRGWLLISKRPKLRE